jgi:hypothetical protein
MRLHGHFGDGFLKPNYVAFQRSGHTTFVRVYAGLESLGERTVQSRSAPGTVKKSVTDYASAWLIKG